LRVEVQKANYKKGKQKKKSFETGLTGVGKTCKHTHGGGERIRLAPRGGGPSPYTNSRTTTKDGGLKNN